MLKHVLFLSLLFVVAPIMAAGSGSSSGSSSALTRAERTYNQGVELMRNGQFNKAEKKFRRAIEREETWAQAHNNLAYTLRKQGEDNYFQALYHYNKAIELAPDLPEPYMYRGVLYVQMQKPDFALRDLETLKRLSPTLATELEYVIAQGSEKTPEQFFGVSAKVEQ
ncbi:tetratricopeptide repeat protein [Vibrio sp. WXL103]|uniref:tetratricopeptide repeat protein n=1 Tax=Vibrio sp. WXL103 TaxID=3450710 RepID=UPI003EC57925